MSPLVDAAENFIREGFNPLPLKKDKSPRLEVGHNFLYSPIDKVTSRFSAAEKIGIACGAVSGGFYCIDFDCHDGEDIKQVFDQFYNDENIQWLLQASGITFSKTMSGGFHAYFRTDDCEYKGTPLAKWPSGTVMIEIRGSGQYIACAPSPGYTHLQGCEIIKLQYIDKTTVDYIIHLAESFNKGELKTTTEKPVRKWPDQWDNSTLEGQYNNESAEEAKDLLIQSGWKFVSKRRHDGVELWQRPGKPEGVSATWGAKQNMFYVFSSSCPPFEPSKAYSPFGIYSLLKFDGDIQKAKDSLRPIKAQNDEAVIEVKSSGFPTEVFPEFIRKYIYELNETLNFSLDYLSAAVMFTVSSVCGNKYKLKVKHGWEAPPIFWFACVGYPGTIKTHPVKAIIRPLMEIDRESKKVFNAEMLHYDPDARPRQPKPKFKQIIISDYTLEALHQVHSYNHRGLGLYKDELKGFIGDMNKYRKGSDEEFWLESFNNGSFTVNRATKDPMMIEDICVNLIGTIQHEVLSKIISDFSGSGFIDRFLFTSPETEVFPITDKEANPEHSERWERFIRYIHNSSNYLDRQDKQLIEMTPEAFKYYQKLDKELVAIQKEEAESVDLKNYLSKMKTYIPRFALILCCIEGFANQDYFQVKEHHIINAGKISDYFIATARQTFDNNRNRSEIARLVQSMNNLTRTEQIKKLYDKGFSQEVIGNHYNISRQRVGRILQNKK